MKKISLTTLMVCILMVFMVLPLLAGELFDAAGRGDIARAHYQSKGAIVTGTIKDRKTIEFIDGSRSAENVLYRQQADA